MTTDLPVPVEFRLPDGWRPAPPDEVGDKDSAFVALNMATHGSGFTANITMRGAVHPAEVSLRTVADAVVAGIRESAPDVSVIGREEIRSNGMAGLTQQLRLTTPAEGDDRELVLSQVLLSVPMATGEQTVLRVMMTATAEQADRLAADFRWFVRTLAPELARPPGPRHTYSSGTHGKG